MQQYPFHYIEKKISLNAVATAWDVIRPKNFVFAGEMHNFWEAVCVKSGSAIVTADDRVYTLSRGDLLFHKPMEFHRVRSANNTAPRLLIISFAADGEALKMLENAFFKLSEYQLREFSRVNALCRSAIELDGRGEKYEWASSRAAAAFEGFILELCGNNSIERRTEPQYAEDYRRIINFMELHCCEGLTVDRIAKECGMSPSTLKRIFRMFCDRGIIEYHNSMRIRLAIKMLEDGTNICAVSDALGFSSPAYFNVAFKRETGLTPKVYRETGQYNRDTMPF